MDLFSDYAAQGCGQDPWVDRQLYLYPLCLIYGFGGLAGAQLFLVI